MSKDLKEVREKAIRVSEERAYQAKRIFSAKAGVPLESWRDSTTPL